MNTWTVRIRGDVTVPEHSDISRVITETLSGVGAIGPRCLIEPGSPWVDMSFVVRAGGAFEANRLGRSILAEAIEELGGRVNRMKSCDQSPIGERSPSALQTRIDSRQSASEDFRATAD
jgi:hypothetical protein